MQSENAAEEPLKETDFSYSANGKNLKEFDTLSIAEVYPTYKEAVAEENDEKVKYLLKDTMYLITTDHGGQTEFLDLMSRFLMGPSLHLIFSRLTDSWDSVFKIYCTNEEGVSTEKEDSIVTLKEITFQTLASIACMKVTKDNTLSSNEYLNKAAILPKAMFIGTFRDEVSLSHFKKRDQILREEIENTEFYHKDIVSYASEEYLTLAIDNMNGTAEEIDKAREIFENCIKENLSKVRIPCSWLMFSIAIRSKDKRTMTLKECRDIGESLNIDCSDLPKVLWFLHYHVGVLLHYPDVRGFEDFIICDIKVSIMYFHIILWTYNDVLTINLYFLSIIACILFTVFKRILFCNPLCACA